MILPLAGRGLRGTRLIIADDHLAALRPSYDRQHEPAKPKPPQQLRARLQSCFTTLSDMA